MTPTTQGKKAWAPPTARRLFISTGCSSADVLTAPLLAELTRRGLMEETIAVGGEPLRDAGATMLGDSTPWSTIGTAQGIGMFLRSGWRVFQTLRQIDREFKSRPPDLAILVDNAGINFRILSIARRHRIPVLYYVPPETWSVWSFEWSGVRKARPEVAAIFPSQIEDYRQCGIEARWIGHPIIDLVERWPTASETVPEDPLISLFPGSRRQEVTELLRPMLEAASLIQQRLPHARFVVGVANPLAERIIDEELKRTSLAVETRYRQTYALLSESHLALACSGTVTLEAALLGVPSVAMYRLRSVIDNLVQRTFLPRSQHPYFSLPNVLLRRAVLPELRNHEVTPEGICEAAWPLLQNDERRAGVLQHLSEIQPILGSAGAVHRAADLAQQMLESSRDIAKNRRPPRAA
ncbi:hypothetical protein K2X85_15375 [bacterium]|nr:hypothetical protein [bacterium]